MRFILLALAALLLFSFAASISLPPGLQSAFEQTVEEAMKISLLIAFLGGIS